MNPGYEHAVSSRRALLRRSSCGDLRRDGGDPPRVNGGGGGGGGEGEIDLPDVGLILRVFFVSCDTVLNRSKGS